MCPFYLPTSHFLVTAQWNRAQTKTDRPLTMYDCVPSNRSTNLLDQHCVKSCQELTDRKPFTVVKPVNDDTFRLQMYNSSTGEEAKTDWFLLPSVCFYNRKLPMSILPESLVSGRIQFSAPIIKTPKKVEKVKRGKEISRAKLKKKQHSLL